MIPAKIYKFTVPANGSYNLLVSGSFFKILSSTAAVGVRSNKLGSIGELLAGQGIERAAFDDLLFTDTSGFANEVRVIIAADLFIDDRISGEVSVIDGGKARTQAGAVFGGRIGLTPVAGQFAQLQFWNPVGSNKRLIVGSFNIIVSTGNAIAGIGSVQLTNLAAVPNVKSKLSGGADGSTEQRTLSAAELVAMTFLNQALSGMQINDPEPYVIMPGFGFNVIATDVSAVLSASAHLIEEVL